MGNCFGAKSPSHHVPTLHITPSEELILYSSNSEIFTFNTLQSATNNFSNDNLLGQGGFGSVFRGLIDGNGTCMEVAVKKLEPLARLDNKEWTAEIKYLGKLHHHNIVRLIGYCKEDQHRMLVYELMPNGSLDKHLFEMGLGLQPLSWNLRIKIALGVANGLAFMHSEADRNPIVHMDIKSANVLLDSNYNAKLADFGLALDSPARVTKKMRGTKGYADVFSCKKGRIDTMYDVYSFGVVLLEMLSGQIVLDPNRPVKDLKIWVKPYLENKGEMIHIFDPRLGGEYPLMVAKKLTSLSYQCISEPKYRPTMAELVGALESLQT
ncbi:hypothetical protein QJS10_CPA07g00189 [Acorus calamus]|uniref:Protein kinase domain-containing protein n=1 Tax=Acorus calamus TaxID=4465 RepID=A0AAV9EE19_ACOCL|nr:hypothetical protein QJS10_CPA07g00189 [Acorus calamus]